MVKILIGTGCGLLALGSAAALYCCIRVGALHDQCLEQPPNEHGKEVTEYHAVSRRQGGQHLKGNL